VNAQAQTQQAEAHGKVATYPERAAGLAVLTTPLGTFRSFLHIAEMLPGDVGGKFHQMDKEASTFERSLGQVGVQMAQTAAQGPGALAGWQAEQERLKDARARAAGGQGTLEVQEQTAQKITEKAKAAAAQRTEAEQKAAAHEAATTKAMEAREARATELAAALATWAAEHREARRRALADTRQKYEQRGYRVSVKGE
jgi:hypothetical protein